MLQDVAVELLKRKEQLDNIRKPLPFLRTCVRCKAIDFVRKETRISPLPPHIITSIVDERSQTQWQYEDMEHIEALLRSFSPQMREAFVMHVLDGYPISVPAKNLGIKPNTLSRRFMRMRERIVQEQQRFEEQARI